MNRRLIKKAIAASIIQDNPTDNRPYVKVKILNEEIMGLLDSGANVSILGKNCEKFLEKSDVKVSRCPTLISTASGDKQRVLGYIDVATKFNDQCKIIRFYLVPSLSQPLYLGINFFELFNVKLSVSELSIEDGIKPLLNTSDNKSEYHLLSSDQQSELKRVIDMLPNCTSLGLGKTQLLSHHIDVGDAKPVKQRHYAVSPAVEQEMYKELDRMISLGVVEESESPWCSPMALVRKSNGKVRLCLDARVINSLTKKDAYPLPLIDGLLSRLDKAKYLSCLDLKDAFWQIPLDTESHEITAFTVPGRPLYQFKVMPFGLCNAPQTLCRLMHKVVPYHLHNRVFVYLDDLLVTSESFAEHLLLLEEVAHRLNAANLTINVDKSMFCLKELTYLGYVVGVDGIKVDKEKIKAIERFPPPKNIRQLRKFIGVTGWYRRFIANYSSLSAPLTNLLKKNTKFVWTSSADSAFNKLKQALTSAPVLVTPDFKRHFYIQCDASSIGIGSVLFQRSDDGGEHPIAYFSQKLNKSQRNYSVTELECLAAVESIKKFRAYVEGLPFTVITDHASLKWLMDQRDLSGRLARWSLKLQGFNFTIEYRKGSQNVVPDSLSRMFDNEAVGETCEVSTDDVTLPPLGIPFDSPLFEEEEYQRTLDALRRRSSAETNVEERNGKIYINLQPGSSYTGCDESKGG